VSVAAQPLLKYEQIERTLGERIRKGFYARSTLPGERELAQEFHVARVTVRTALQRLLDQGLVVRLQDSGPLVPTGDFGTAPKRLLQERVDKFLDRGRQDRRRVLSYSRVPATATLAQTLDLPVDTRLLKVVRLRSDAQSPLTYTIAHIGLTHAVAMTRSALQRHAMVQLLMQAGVRIGAVDQTIEAASAPIEVAQALLVQAHAPVLRLTRLVRDETGHPIQLLEGWYRADRFSIQMIMSPAEDATTVWIEQRDSAGTPGQMDG